MENQNTYTIIEVSKVLSENYNATKVEMNELFNQSNYENSKNIVGIYKIEDEKVIQNLLSENEKKEILITIDHLEKNNLIEAKEESELIDMHKISTGKLIVIILESEDKVNLSGFIMYGNGEALYNYITNMVGENLEKSYNTLEDTINELKKFKPYGTYM